jgi:hypothetical protein
MISELFNSHNQSGGVLFGQNNSELRLFINPYEPNESKLLDV